MGDHRLNLTARADQTLGVLRSGDRPILHEQAYCMGLCLLRGDGQMTCQKGALMRDDWLTCVRVLHDQVRPDGFLDVNDLRVIVNVRRGCLQRPLAGARLAG